MKNLSTFTLTLVTIALLASVTVAGSSCPVGCDCPEKTVSVTCFGAVPDDESGDSVAIQDAIDSVEDGWTIYFPGGVYIVDIPLEIGRSNISLAGAGIESELLTPQNTNYPLLNFPRYPYTISCPITDPSNITIEKLTFNGNFNQGDNTCPLNSACNVTTGIWIREGHDITFRDIIVKQFGLEGISISNGAMMPKDITLLRVRTQKVRRTAIHFGMGENITLEDSSLEDIKGTVSLTCQASQVTGMSFTSKHLTKTVFLMTIHSRTNVD